MFKKGFFVLLSILFVPSFVLAEEMAEMEAKVDTLCASIVDVEGRDYPELALHDLLDRLSQSTEAMGDLTRLSTWNQDEVDESLKPYLKAYDLLYIALTSPLREYADAFNAYKKTNPSPHFLNIADIIDILKSCEDCPSKCKACNGSKRCAKCKGRGYIMEAAKSALGSSTRKKCTTCDGAKHCKSCARQSTTCKSCGGARRVVDAVALKTRIQTLMTEACEQSAILLAEELNAREQTYALAKEIRKVNSTTYSKTDPKKVLEVINDLPKELQAATTWTYIPPLREIAEAMLAEQEHNSPEKVRMRNEIEQAIAEAQAEKTAEGALLHLISPMQRCQTSEQFPILETTLNGFIKQWQREREDVATSLEKDFETALEVKDLNERLIALERFLENCRLPKINARLKSEIALYEQLQSTDEVVTTKVKELQNKVVEAIAVAEAEKTAEEQKARELEDQKTPWWIWASIIGGVVIILYFVYSAFQMIGEHRAKKAKEAQRKATLDSIRNTFARRKHH